MTFKPSCWNQKGSTRYDLGTAQKCTLSGLLQNANSSMIVGTSPSIEPNKANAYTHRTRAGSHLIKNKYLEKVLDDHNMNNSEIWTSIVTNGGSVSHLEFLSDEIKEVFKTAVELDQMRLVELGGQNKSIWIKDSR